MYKYVIWCIAMMILSYNITEAASVRDLVSQWETTSMKQSSLSQWYLIPQVLSILTWWCPMDDSMTSQIKSNFDKSLLEIWLTLNTKTADQYYKLYQPRHDTAQSYASIQYYCFYKILTYQLQYRFYLISQWLDKPINPVRSNATYRSEYFQLLSGLNKKHQTPSIIAPLLTIKVSNRAQVLKMSAITKQVAVEMTTLYRNIVAESLLELRRSGILTHNDVADIWSKITFNYVEQCSELRWFTKVILTRSGGKVIGWKLSTLSLNINVCEDKSYLTDFDAYIKDLVYHEIAHYIYYIKDTKKASFESICTSTKCVSTDYVTEYASTAPEEDYAETFQFWKQKKSQPYSSVVLQKKFDYFEWLFGKWS